MRGRRGGSEGDFKKIGKMIIFQHIMEYYILGIISIRFLPKYSFFLVWLDTEYETEWENRAEQTNSNNNNAPYFDQHFFLTVYWFQLYK